MKPETKFDPPEIYNRFSPDADAVIFQGNCLELLRQVPDKTVQLVVTSPPYNIGKSYEKKISLETYYEQQKEVIEQCARVLTEEGSICWQVGNHVDNGAIIPLDSLLFPIFHNLGFVMRNRIIWCFEHGLHSSRRLSGRYETVIWFTRNTKDYVFNLDPIRVPQKYPGKKYFKGPKAGQYSCNPLGKNPGDVWDIPNVKSNHVEKTEHPCQFPVELIERFVLSLSNKGDWVLDPYLGVGSSVIAAVKHQRKGMGSELVSRYVEIAKERTKSAMLGNLRTRPMGTPKYDPIQAGNKLTVAPWNTEQDERQLRLLQSMAVYKP